MRLSRWTAIAAIAAIAASLLAARAAEAANRYFFVDQSVTAGETGVAVFLRADVDQEVFGFSFGVNYDETALTVTGVDVVGTVIDVDDPDFFDGRIDAGAGLVGYGCVLDFFEPYADVIQPGTNLALVRFVVDVIGAAGTSSQVRLESVPTNPNPAQPVKNIMTNEMGVSLLPALTPGTITIQPPPAPQITSLAGNAGQEGTEFTAVGLNFGEPGLTVRVCEQAASFTLSGDQTTLTITAPACGATGFATLEVCNTHGCDSEPQGFNYLPTGGSQRPGDCNQDGTLDISDAVCLLGHLFLGSPEVLPCEGGTPTDPGNRALLSSNGDLNVDISDAVWALNFLFAGGLPPTLGTDCVAIVGCPENCVP